MSQKALLPKGVTFCQLPIRCTAFSATAAMQLKGLPGSGRWEKVSGFLKILRDVEKRVVKARAALEAAGIEPGHCRTPSKTRYRNLARSKGVNASLRQWVPMKSSAGYSIPHICIKLSTGGGKTFVAGACGRSPTNRTPAGGKPVLALWVTPSDAIYQQTLRQLHDREAPFRQVLERASGGRVKLLEKLDAFSESDIRDRLCVMLLMLQAANRSKLTKGDLKIRSDFGSYPSFFPEPDDRIAHNALLARVPNLERNDLGGEAGGGTVKSSLENVLRIVRPVVVLDEGHKAYSDQARATIANLNPSFVLELSATPKPEHSNILINV